MWGQAQGGNWQQPQNWSGGGGGGGSWQGAGGQGAQASGGGGNSWQQGGAQASGGAGAAAASGGGASWGGGTNGSWSQPQQQAAGGWGQAQQQAAPQQASGPPSQMVVSGCQHATIGSIVRGTFTVHSENHAKPVYQRDTQVSGLDVMIYYWDERDGPSQAGWWFGPKVGGEQVWAYNPDLTTKVPPRTGWQVPYGGPVDASFVVEQQGGQPAASAPGASAPGGCGQQPQSQQGSWQQPQQQQQQQPQQNSWQQPQQQQQQQPQQQPPQQPSWGNQRGQAQQGWGNQQGGQQSWNSQDSQQKQRETELQRQMDVMKQRNEAQHQQQQRHAQEQQANSWQARQHREMQTKQKQMEEMKKRQEENKKRLEEARQKQQEEQKKKMEEMKRLREAAAQKQKEEQERKMKEMQDKKDAELRKQREVQATFAVRRIAQKIRVVPPEKFEALEKEIQEELQTELELCGSQAERMKEEYEKCLEQTRKRIGDFLERKRKEEEKKAEIERLRKEKEDRAKARCEKLTELVEAAEAEAEKLKEIAKEEEFIDSAELASSEVEARWQKVTDAEKTCREAYKTCAAFFREHGAELKDRAHDSDIKQTFGKLLVRVQDSQRSSEQAMVTAKKAKETCLKLALAKEKTKLMESVFKKYDADRDGALSEKEILAYAKGEHGVKVEKDIIAWIMSSMVEEGSKGVKLERMHRLRCVIGSRRELARDKKRKEFRIEKEAVIGGLKDALKEKVTKSVGKVSKVEKEIRVAEEKAGGMQKKARVLPPAQLISCADESDEKLQVAKGAFGKVQKEMEQISESIEPKYEKELKAHLAVQAKQVRINMQRMDMRIRRVEKIAARYREQAKCMQIDELEDLRRKALRVMRYNQGLKKMTNEDLFDLFNNGSGEVDEKSWNAFFETAETDVQEILVEEEVKEDDEAKEEAPAEEAEEAEEGGEKNKKTKDEEADGSLQENTGENGESKKEDAADAKEEKSAVANGEATEGNAAEAKEEKPAGAKKEESKEDKPAPVVEKVELSADELSRLFDYLDEESEGSLSKERFLQNARWLMKVVKDTAMTSELGVKGAKAKRKLDPKEIVEVMKGPLRDSKMRVTRVYVKALKDELEGWVSVSGNQGTVFLEDCCAAKPLYKVIRPSLMTDAFETNGESKDDSSMRLRTGTVLEVREPPRKEEVSGLTRMKGRVRSVDGSVGWVTTIGKDGKVFCKEYV